MIYQSGDKIIVTELRPMSEAPLNEWAIYFNKNFHSFEAQYIGNFVVTAYNDFIKTNNIEGWIPMPIYQHEES